MNKSEMKWFDRLIYAIAKVIVAIGIAILHPLRIVGKEHFPQKQPFIVIANHLSMWDVFFIARMMFPARTIFMGKEELFANPFARWAVGVGGGYPVKRGTADISAIKKALKALKEGHVFCIFPEGTRNRKQDGTLQKFFNGIGYIALTSGAQVVPVYFPDNGFKAFRRVRVLVGPPVPLQDLQGTKVTGDSTEQATNRVLNALHELRESSITAEVAQA